MTARPAAGRNAAPQLTITMAPIELKRVVPTSFFLGALGTQCLHSPLVPKLERGKS